MTPEDIEKVLAPIVCKAVATAMAMRPRPSSVDQKQAAEMLEVSQATVSRMVRSGTIKRNVAGRIPMEEVDRVLSTPGRA